MPHYPPWLSLELLRTHTMCASLWKPNLLFQGETTNRELMNGAKNWAAKSWQRATPLTTMQDHAAANRAQFYSKNDSAGGGDASGHKRTSEKEVKKPEIARKPFQLLSVSVIAAGGSPGPRARLCGCMRRHCPVRPWPFEFQVQKIFHCLSS